MLALSCAGARPPPSTGVEAPQPATSSPAPQEDHTAALEVPDAGAATEAAPAPGQAGAGRLVVTADVVRGQRSPDGCRLTLRAVTIDEAEGESEVLAISPGDSFEASTPCYTFTLHQMERGGTFRFHLLRRAAKSLDAQVIGGRIIRPLRSAPLRPK